MIGRLRGTLISKSPPWLLVEVGGIGYELEAPMSTFYDLPEAGREVVLLTHHVQKVTGIGAKLALAILSGASVEDFARLVQSADVAALTRIPGIGKKTAERLVVELRDRAAAFAVPGVPGTAAAVPHDPLAEASVALQQLGYKPAEVQRMLKAAEPGDRAEEIIRKALKSVLRTG